MTAIPKYEAYKDSGVEWLGEIPAHWEIAPLKHSLSLTSEKIFSRYSTLKYYGMENVESWTGRFIETESEVEGLANKFNKNDILFGKLKPYLAKVALTENEGICSTEFLVYRARKNLFWFLKFLIPKLIVKDSNADQIDELLNSVDLSSYGLERVKLNHSIGLDASETELEPQNPNPRGAHGGDQDHDPLDEIIRSFNERWFQGWGATPEEQRIKFINIADGIKAHPDFEEKYQNNPDVQNRELAFEKIFDEVILKNRRNELGLYKLLANDADFKAAMQQSLRQMVGI